MKTVTIKRLILPLLIVGCLGSACQKQDESAQSFGMVIHGGTGGMSEDKMTPEMKSQYEATLQEALQVGYKILNNQGSSLDAVQATINVLEDSPLFNAGKGAGYTHDGTHELDASIMDGNTLNVGAVAGVKNPISLARLVMDKSEHVMMTGSGAEAFGKKTWN
jgi:L-asparaginase / beta-aspartyl-peptidase